MIKKKTSIKFSNSKDLGKRNWGKEILLTLIPKKISLKKLIIFKGQKGGFQYHRKKNECGIIISGKLKIIFDNGGGKLLTKILKRGDSFHFPPGAIHQEHAITDCQIIEASTPYFNDRVRVEKKFKLKEEFGLRTTKASEIKLI